MHVFSVAPKFLKLKSLDDPVNLYILGDIHEGEASCDDDLFREVIGEIKKDPRAVVLGNGDYGSFIAPDDKRWEPLDVAPRYSIADLDRWGDTLVESLYDAMKPLRGKILGLVPGNHEDRYGIRHHCDPTADLAEALRTPRLEYVNEFGLIFESPEGTRSLEIHQTHGTGNARFHGTKLYKLQQIVNTTTARLILLGHVHGRGFYEFDRTKRVGDDLVLEQQYGCITGTFARTYKKGHSNYAERSHYPPTPVGCPRLTIHPRTLKVDCVWLGE